MTKNSVPEADGTNSVRLAETFPARKAETRGAEPRPIRKKGFWRAFRRKELWAIVPYRHYLAQQRVLKDLYAETYADPMCPENTIYVTWPMRGLKWIVDNE